MQKKETMVAPADMPKEMAPYQGGGPKGDDKPVVEGPLGLDADGSAGADGFWQRRTRAAGTSLPWAGAFGTGGGGMDQTALQRKFGWYTRLVGEELNRLVRKRLEETGACPRAHLEVEVRIEMDERGAITEYRITRSSGNQAMDNAVEAIPGT